MTIYLRTSTRRTELLFLDRMTELWGSMYIGKVHGMPVTLRNLLSFTAAPINTDELPLTSLRLHRGFVMPVRFSKKNPGIKIGIKLRGKRCDKRCTNYPKVAQMYRFSTFVVICKSRKVSGRIFCTDVKK